MRFDYTLLFGWSCILCRKNLIRDLIIYCIIIRRSMVNITNSRPLYNPLTHSFPFRGHFLSVERVSWGLPWGAFLPIPNLNLDSGWGSFSSFGTLCHDNPWHTIEIVCQPIQGRFGYVFCQAEIRTLSAAKPLLNASEGAFNDPTRLWNQFVS